jgi:ASPIC and UnbV/FG-GAP-like repeat/FlgD Ig-like domain
MKKRFGLGLAILGILLANVTASVSASTDLRFVRADSSLGINVVNQTWGLTWGDYNGDHYPDVFIGNHENQNPKLLRNSSGATFVHEINGSGITPPGDRHGAAWGDYDNDGRLDLYVAIGAQSGTGVGYNQLFQNHGAGHFDDISSTAGTTDPTGRGRFVNWIDIDNDGWLDLFVTNESTPNRLFHNAGNGTFTDILTGDLTDDILWYPAWTDLNNDGFLDLAIGSGWGGRFALFQNDRHGGFDEITPVSGLPNVIWGLKGLCWFDYDNDGDEDLYVSRGQISHLRDAVKYDESEVRFLMYMPDNDDEDGLDGIRLVTDSSILRIEIKPDWLPPTENIFLGYTGVHPVSSTFIVANGQYIGRPSFEAGADFGCYIWQDAYNGPWNIHCSTDFDRYFKFGGKVEALVGQISEVDIVQIEEPSSSANISDLFYRNQGDGTFVNRTSAANLGSSLSGRTCFATDFDNNGWLDLYLVHERNTEGSHAMNQSNALYLNNCDGTFEEVAGEAGVDCQVGGTGASAGWADYDLDGFPDIYVTNGSDFFPFNEGPHVVYHNEGNENHWLRLHLVGTESNRDGIGARVWLDAGGLTQYRIQNGAVNDMSQSCMDVHFGLGEATEIDGLTIIWPSGTRQHYEQLGIDTVHTIVEGPTAAADQPFVDSQPATLSLEGTQPCRGGATLNWELLRAADIHLAVYDPSGRLVRTLYENHRDAGTYSIRWDGCDNSGKSAATGIYYSRLLNNDQVCSCRIFLVQ